MWNDLPYLLEKQDIDTFYWAKKRLEFLSLLRPVRYDCCRSSCCCFVGPYANLARCPYCDLERRRPDGKPYKSFSYLPVIPQLQALFRSPELATKMLYCSIFHTDAGEHVDGSIKDVFDGTHYKHLLEMKVQIDGKTQNYKFFSGERDIALGLSTDGFSPFKRRKHSCWPLILFNYNLPPDIRTHLDNIICCGVIPGPKAVKDIDSFLYPLIDELMLLASGVGTMDAREREMFPLRVYLIKVFGDMPAMAKLMRMKGHNGLLPCRMCKIRGLRIPGARGTAHYCPLDRSKHPNRGDISRYDPKSLPLRTHEEMLAMGAQVEDPNITKAESERLSTKYGINGVPAISRLSSIRLPGCCPHDLMHIALENDLPNMIKAWTGTFKGLPTESIDSTVWKAIGEATSSCGSTIPSQFGGRVPNLAA